MEWHVTVFGEIDLPEDRVEEWLRLTIDPDAFDDWKGEVGGATYPPEPAERVLERLRAVEEPNGHLEMRVERGRISVRGYLKDEGYRAWAAHLAAALRATSAVGAKGALFFVNVAGEYAYELTVEPGRSTFAEIKGRKKIERIALSPAGEEASDLYGRSFQHGGAPDPTERAGAAERRGAVWAKILAQLEQRSDHDLHAALRARGGLAPAADGELRPAVKAHRDGASVRAVLRGAATDATRAFGLDLLARLDPPAAEALSIEVLRADPEPLTAVSAAYLLGQSSAPEAPDVLLDVATSPLAAQHQSVVDEAIRALQGSTSAGAAARLFARLTADVIARPESGPLLGAALGLAAARGVAVPDPTWLEIWRHRREPDLREQAARALASSASHEAAEALAEGIAEPGVTGQLAAQALLRLDPGRAFDRIAPHVSGELAREPARTVVQNMFSALYDSESKKRGKASGGHDSRWIDLALRALEVPSVIPLLGVLRSDDPRVLPALVDLLDRGKCVEDVVDALKKLGDPAAIPALERALRLDEGPYVKKLIRSAIERLSTAGAGQGGGAAPASGGAGEPRKAKGPKAGAAKEKAATKAPRRAKP